MPLLAAERIPELLEDLDAALRELTDPWRRDPGGWRRGPAGKWSAGQHVEHVGKVLAIGAEALERSAEQMRAGRLGRRPWRDPLQAWFVGLVTRDPFPRGGRAPKAGMPSAAPEPGRALEAIGAQARRYRDLAADLTVEERGRLWVWNPFLAWPRCHYTLPEVIRVQATHARHHARLAAAAAAAG
jgi:hypothetical protein